MEFLLNNMIVSHIAECPKSSVVDYALLQPIILQHLDTNVTKYIRVVRSSSWMSLGCDGH